MGTHLVKPPPGSYSVTPDDQKHIRIVYIPYDYTQLGLNVALFWLSPGSKLLERHIDMGRHRWVFVVDVSGEFYTEDKFGDNDGFDFRTMMRDA